MYHEADVSYYPSAAAGSMATMGQSYPGHASRHHSKRSTDYSGEDIGTSSSSLSMNSDLEWVVNEHSPVPIAYEL